MLVKWLYRKIVNELYVPDYQTFSIGLKHPEIAPTWNSFLPDKLTLHIKTKEGACQQAVLTR